MNKSALALSLTSILLALIVAYLGFKMGGSPFEAARNETAAWGGEQQRALAGKLKGAGLARQAAQAYEAYATSADIAGPQLASLAYTIGTLYLDAGNYEDALAWLYRVEIADPATSLKTEVGSRIIHCLERLGKHSAAEYALDKRAGQTAPAGREGSVVVAEIGSEKIYRENIDEALDGMPDWMRTQFDAEDAKAGFLKKYVADELFYRKALKLEFDKDPALRKKLAAAKKELLVNKVVESELKDKIAFEQEDVRNYFSAHQNDYVQKEAVKVSLIKAGMSEIADKIAGQLKGGKDFNEFAREVSIDKNTAENGGRINRWIRNGEDDLGIGKVATLAKVLFSTAVGAVTPPVEAGGAWYIFRIDEKRPEKMPAFDEVAERVKQDYYMTKLKASYQRLLEQILKTSEVKLYPDKLKGGSAP